MDKEVRKLIQAITPIPGVKVEHGGKHVKELYRDKLVTTMAATPSDHRWRDNTVAALRRAGITPGTKVKATMVEVDHALTLEQLRESLSQLFASKRGTAAEFSRFTQDEVAPMLGLPPYKTFASAEMSISSFAKGRQKGLTDKTFLLVSESLRLWEQRHRSVTRAEQSNGNGFTPEQDACVLETEEPERPTPPADPAAVHLVVDLDFLNAALSKFGLRLEVNR